MLFLSKHNMEQKDRWGYVCKLCSCQPIVVGESGWLNVKEKTNSSFHFAGHDVESSNRNNDSVWSGETLWATATRENHLKSHKVWDVSSQRAWLKLRSSCSQSVHSKMYCVSAPYLKGGRGPLNRTSEFIEYTHINIGYLQRILVCVQRHLEIGQSAKEQKEAVCEIQSRTVGKTPMHLANSWTRFFSTTYNSSHNIHHVQITQIIIHIQSSILTRCLMFFLAFPLCLFSPGRKNSQGRFLGTPNSPGRFLGETEAAWCLMEGTENWKMVTSPQWSFLVPFIGGRGMLLWLVSLSSKIPQTAYLGARGFLNGCFWFPL